LVYNVDVSVISHLVYNCAKSDVGNQGAQVTLLSDTQVTWLEALYKATVGNRVAASIPQRTFNSLKEFGCVAGSATTPSIAPSGTSLVLRRIKDREKAAKAQKGKQECSQNCKKNSDQATFNFQ
jgi:hypothetical protein